MPDIENSRRTAEKGAEWVAVKPPKKQTTVFRVFRLFFRLFYRDPLGTLFSCFSDVFNVGNFGTSVDGRRDCKTSPNTGSWIKQWHKLQITPWPRKENRARPVKRADGPVNLGGEKTHKEKTRKQNFHGIVPEFLGGFCLCVFLPHKE